jgi:hypothetical protein
MHLPAGFDKRGIHQSDTNDISCLPADPDPVSDRIEPCPDNDPPTKFLNMSFSAIAIPAPDPSKGENDRYSTSPARSHPEYFHLFQSSACVTPKAANLYIYL